LHGETYVLRHDIVGPPVLHKEPEPFNRVEVGEHRREIERFEVVPLKGFLPVPGALSRMRTFRFRVKVRPLSASFRKAWKMSEETGIAFKTRFIAKPDLGIILFAQHAKLF
jgi:hypothetical protein